MKAYKYIFLLIFLSLSQYALAQFYVHIYPTQTSSIVIEFSEIPARAANVPVEYDGQNELYYSTESLYVKVFYIKKADEEEELTLEQIFSTFQQQFRDYMAYDTPYRIFKEQFAAEGFRHEEFFIEARHHIVCSNLHSPHTLHREPSAEQYQYLSDSHESRDQNLEKMPDLGIDESSTAFMQCVLGCRNSPFMNTAEKHSHYEKKHFPSKSKRTCPRCSRTFQSMQGVINHIEMFCDKR